MNSPRLVLSLTLIAALSGCEKTSSEAGKSNVQKKQPVEVSPAGKTTDRPPAGSEPTGPGSSLKAAGGSYTVDSAHSQVIFKIQHLGASYQYGQFTRVEGSFSIDSTNIGANAIDVSVPAISLFTADKKRDDHLRGPDFLDAKQFPKMAFKSKTVKITGANTYSVTGDLSLHGVTKSVTLELEHGGAATDPEMMGGSFRTGFNGELVIKRSDFGMNYMQGALGDEVTLLLALEGTRN